MRQKTAQCRRPRGTRCLAACVALGFFGGTAETANGGVYVRFKMTRPDGAKYYVRLGGYIHKVPWYLPGAVVPDGADRDANKRIEAGEFTPWFDLGKHAGDRLHGRLMRSGGVAEFPNVTAEFVTGGEDRRRTIVIELATAFFAAGGTGASPTKVVKRWEETFVGTKTSFLVSPDLRKDAARLETASEMTQRRLRWAHQASGGRRAAPKQLIVQTSFWAPQRPELNLQEARVLHLLGFNVVGNQPPSVSRGHVREQLDLRLPGHTHQIKLGPAATREEIDELMKEQAAGKARQFEPGVPFGFGDEVVCRPRIGDDAQALAHFHAWLAARQIRPQSLGAERLSDVAPLETPDDFRRSEKQQGEAARRVFYLTSRFRQQAATQRVRWHTEAFHRHFPPGPVTSTLVADHPYFGGTGLGMGMVPNSTWGGAPLAMDWFELARTRAVDLAGIEDWMGLQYMYGPATTWEGFQLMGFQAAIFRSGSRATLPIIAWITPSDETNLRLKSASALCQGAKHFFYWTYGPTATSTENYWSDLRGAYDGIVRITRQLAAAEHVIAPGKTRPTRVALLYSISSDLWQPFGYVHMLERRGTYLSLVHDQFLVDMLTEQDVEAGRLGEYDVLYATDPCITRSASRRIERWVEAGGHLFGSCAAGSRNEFGQPVSGLAEVFGIGPEVKTTVQPGRYHIRGALNEMRYPDRIGLAETDAEDGQTGLGVIGVKVDFTPTTAKVIGTFRDGAAALVVNAYGKGSATYAGACPAISYIKDAKFVPGELKEKWPAPQRRFINATARRRGVPRLVELSHPVVEAGVFDSPQGSALVLANFTYEPIERLAVRLPVRRPPQSVRSVERGKLPFTLEKSPSGDAFPHVLTFEVQLGLNDVVLVE